MLPELNSGQVKGFNIPLICYLIPLYRIVALIQFKFHDFKVYSYTMTTESSSYETLADQNYTLYGVSMPWTSQRSAISFTLSMISLRGPELTASQCACIRSVGDLLVKLSGELPVHSPIPTRRNTR
jgi:hypothetical protein